MSGQREKTGRRIFRFVCMELFCLLLTGLCACGEPTRLTAYERGMAALESGDLDAALTYFSESAATEGEEALGRRGEGLIYLERGAYDQAIRAFSDCLDSVRYPRLNKAFIEDTSLYLADAYHKNGKPEQALTIYSQLLQGDRAGEAYLLRGKIYADEGKFGQAGKDFQRAIEQDDSYEIYLQIYDVYARLNRQADGAAFLKEAQDNSSDSAEDAFQLGRIHYLLGQYDQAKEYLTRAMQDGVAGASALLGKVYLEEGDLSGARTIFQKCIDEESDVATGHNGLALCYMETEEYQKALQQIHEGLQFADKEKAEQLLFNEIVIYERQRQFSDAYEKIESFLKTYPSNAEAQKEALFLQSRLTEEESVPEDISMDVWAQIMQDWEAEAEQQTQEEAPSEEMDSEEGWEEQDLEGTWIEEAEEQEETA